MRACGLLRLGGVSAHTVTTRAVLNRTIHNLRLKLSVFKTDAQGGGRWRRNKLICQRGRNLFRHYQPACLVSVKISTGCIAPRETVSYQAYFQSTAFGLSRLSFDTAKDAQYYGIGLHDKQRRAFRAIPACVRDSGSSAHNSSRAI